MVLTDRDLLQEEYNIFPYAKQHNGEIPAEMAPGIRSGAMDMIIFEELAYQQAVKMKMTVPAAKLSKAEADFRKQFESPSQYRHYVQSEYQGNEQLSAGKNQALAVDRAVSECRGGQQVQSDVGGNEGLLR